ncbi:MAG: hypothetical protein WBP45_10005 [Daejeonella sp.]
MFLSSNTESDLDLEPVVSTAPESFTVRPVVSVIALAVVDIFPLLVERLQAEKAKSDKISAVTILELMSTFLLEVSMI